MTATPCFRIPSVIKKILAASLLMPFVASADPIVNGSAGPLNIVTLNDAGFSDAMTGMDSTAIALSGYADAGDAPGSVALGSGQLIQFSDANGHSPTRGAGTTHSWWNGASDLFLGTHTNTITIDFTNLYVVGLSFAISAVNSRYSAWVGATALDPHGNQVAHIERTNWFGGLAGANAKRVGVYVAGGSKGCSRISQVVVDPTITWGIGDMTYYSNPDCAAKVPEPGSLGLLGLGLVGLAVMRRRRLPTQS